MHVLGPEYYVAWREISNDAVRYWIRLWQNGFYRGTHPEWAFNPLTLSGLGRLWPLFAPVPNERDFRKKQRYAIQDLALGRASLPDGKEFPCPMGREEPEWNDYWTRVSNANAAFQVQLYERLSALLTSTDSPDYVSISKVTAVLAGELLLAGYSGRELWARAAGILDPRGNKTIPHIDRVLGLLGHLKRRPTSEFVVWTDILRNGKPLSNQVSRRIASVELQSPEEWKGGDGFVRLGGLPKAISRMNGTHSVTAFLNHRVSAWDGLRERSAKFAMPGLALAEASLVRQLTLPDRDPWRYTTGGTSFQYLPRANPVVESAAFAAGLEAVDDDPEETVRLLCDALERQLGEQWPEFAGRTYIDRLKSEICSRGVSMLQETHDRWKGKRRAPTWLHTFRTDQWVDFVQVAMSIRQSGPDADLLLAEKLELAARGQYSTPRRIVPWLYLAKGIRNREVHAELWPLELRCVAAFVARLLLYVFVTNFPKASTELEGIASA